MMRLNVVFFSCCLVECLRWQQRKQTLEVISTFVLWETPALPRVKYSSKMYFMLSGMSSVTAWLDCEQAYSEALGAGSREKKGACPIQEPHRELAHTATEYCIVFWLPLSVMMTSSTVLTFFSITPAAIVRWEWPLCFVVVLLCSRQPCNRVVIAVKPQLFTICRSSFPQ